MPSNDQNTPLRETLFTDPSGQPLATAAVPQGWQCSAAVDPQYQSSGYPNTLHIEAVSPDGSLRFFAESGRSYTQILKDFSMAHQDGVLVPETGARLLRFHAVDEYLDRTARLMVGPQSGISLLHEMEQLPLTAQPDPAQMQCLCPTAVSARMELVSIGILPPTVDVRYYRPLTRIYRVESGGRAMALLLACSVCAFRWAENVPPIMAAGMNMFSGLSSGLLGGLNGLLGRDGSADAMPDGGAGVGMRAPTPQEQALRTPVPDKPASFTEWAVPALYGILAPDFTAGIPDAFVPFCSSIQLGQSFLQDQAQKIQAAVDTLRMVIQQQQTQANIFSMNAQRDISRRQMEIGRSISARGNMVMDSWNNRQAAYDRMNQNFSEAIRGVNTYVRPDGSTAEYSVAADRVFMKDNDPTTLRSAKFGEEVPYGWTELNKQQR